MSTIITRDIQQRVQQIITEQNELVLERSDVIHGFWVARVAQEHILMLGPGGTAKSFLARNGASHIDGSVYFEVAFDETTDPSQVFGPPDIKAMVEDGKTRRVLDGMFAEATDAFLDEFFNANGPVLHSLQPPLNERVIHNNGQSSPVPLRTAVMGTNKLNADADQAPLWDRVHLRYIVDYVTQRANQADMVASAIARMSVAGRGVTTSIATNDTKVTLEELDIAHKEALSLDVPDPVMELFLDIRDELKAGGVNVSDRRMVEGMAAVLANSWVNGHETVLPGDLSILANMWWTLQDQIADTRSIVLAATNPGEKAAIDLLEDLDKIKIELKKALDSDADEERKRRAGVEAVRNTDKLLREARQHLDSAKASGASTQRIEDTIGKADAWKIEVGQSVFKIDPNSMAAMTSANA